MSVRNMFYPEGKAFSNREERLFAREDFVYNVTEDILILLEDLGVSKQELASRLGKSRSFITQVLSGSRNMTLGTLSDICFSLSIKPKLNLGVTQTDVWDYVIKDISTKTPSKVVSIKNVSANQEDSHWEAFDQRMVAGL